MSKKLHLVTWVKITYTWYTIPFSFWITNITNSFICSLLWAFLFFNHLLVSSHFCRRLKFWTFGLYFKRFRLLYSTSIIQIWKEQQKHPTFLGFEFIKYLCRSVYLCTPLPESELASPKLDAPPMCILFTMCWTIWWRLLNPTILLSTDILDNLTVKKICGNGFTHNEKMKTLTAFENSFWNCFPIINDFLLPEL